MDKQKLTTGVKWALGLGAALVVAPVVFMMIKGIVGLAVAAVLGLLVVNFAPVLARKVANWKLLALKDEARTNPIETRQNIAIAARQRLLKAQQELQAFATEVRNFASEVNQLAREQPDDAADFQKQLAQLQGLLQLKTEKLQVAKREADEFDAKTARAARKWKVAQSAIRMQKLAGAQADDAMNKLLAEESLDAVETAMNQAFAEMDSTFALQAAPINHPAIVKTPATVKVL